MSKESAEDFVAQAISHAKKRWCLDDEEIVREWCEQRAASDSPEIFIDTIAIDLGLIDAGDDAGAARAARQLLAEYKDVFGEAGKELLAKLPA